MNFCLQDPSFPSLCFFSPSPLLYTSGIIYFLMPNDSSLQKLLS